MDVLSGSFLADGCFISGYVCIEDGILTAIEEGKPPVKPLASGLVAPPLVNSHTHCADYGLRIPPGMTIEELVAPPDGLKHRYLGSLSEEHLRKNIRDYGKASRDNGIGTFIDFREGGIEGCRALRDTVPGSTILGRPVGERYDPEEIAGILEISDGIGIPSISDMDAKYIEKVADQTRNAGKIFAIHASERVREDIDLILSMDPAFIVHMTEATDSDLLKCAEAEVPIVVCARSNLYFGKRPPIKRMLDCGADVAVGTDNAMFSGPDMRSETSVFAKILSSQGGTADDAVDPMLTAGRKILYPHNKIHITVGMAADLAVLPCVGEFSFERMLHSSDPVFVYEPGRGSK